MFIRHIALSILQLNKMWGGEQMHVFPLPPPWCCNIQLIGIYLSIYLLRRNPHGEALNQVKSIIPLFQKSFSRKLLINVKENKKNHCFYTTVIFRKYSKLTFIPTIRINKITWENSTLRLKLKEVDIITRIERGIEFFNKF